ncbi:DUF4421 family protein [Flavobacterium sp. Fl-318]|uniref:DUF4421 family protein n=2 Tax=Flavobacteriaceae TaxID=49546 RepID=A0ABU4R964_9FLAO|nr:DUF4421 family protein [Flavobacterium sp. Fl-318]MDX6188786.1 DUF4421 family protein [Flavobacterium sp. Fl-318]
MYISLKFFWFLLYFCFLLDCFLMDYNLKKNSCTRSNSSNFFPFNTTMKLYLSLLLIFVSPFFCAAQIDTTYIKPFENKFSVSSYLALKFLSLEQETNGETKKFMPNTPMSLGLGVTVNNTIINFSYGYGLGFMRDDKKGRTKAFDFQLHNYGRKFTVDLFIQKYRGFYTADNSNKNIQLYPDLKIQQYGAFGQYIFNNKKFSYKAAFNQNERQLKSAGSWLLGGGVYFTKIDSDSSFVHKSKNSLRNFQFGVSGGYAYTWAISKRWFTSGSITAGVNFGTERINDFGKKKIEIYPTFFPRISAGYNKEKWSLGLSYINNLIFSSFSQDSDGTNNGNSTGLASGNFQIAYIWRLGI